jgi:hypothetical protein
LIFSPRAPHKLHTGSLPLATNTGNGRNDTMTKADPNIYQHFIDGAYVDPIDKEWFDTLDPFRGEGLTSLISKARRAEQTDVELASAGRFDI